MIAFFTSADSWYKQWVCAAALCFGTLAPCFAQSVPLDELEQQAFQRAADFAQDCVVQVETFGGQEIVNKQWVASGPSSGTVLSPDGWIVTSIYQFRSQPASITVVLPDDQRKAAKLVARDYSRELAILKVDTDKPLRAAIASPKVDWQVGQWAIALGKTFDTKVASRSVGILSAKGRIFDKAIQSDAKISPQNYGGPLIDLRGRVMGILAPLNPGIATEGEAEQWYDSGVGFAVPLADVLTRLERLQRGEDIYPGKAGFRSQSPDEFAPEIVLSGVTPGSPAAKAGMKAGDRIVGAGLDRQSIRTLAMHSELKHVMGPVDANQTVVFEVERNGSREVFDVTLVKDLPTYREPYLGIVVNSNDAKEPYRIDAVVPGSPAAKADIKVGDRIVAVNGIEFTANEKLESRILFQDYRDPLRLTLKNSDDGSSREVTLAMTARPETDFEWPIVKQSPPANAAEPKGAKGTVQLPLGDVKNKAFAIVPSTYFDEIPHGLLLVFADAGPQDQKQWSDAWDVFCRENRWIVVVAQSAEEKAWTFEEVEVAARLRNYMSTTYTIDSRRICMGGVSAGVLPAYVAAMQGIETFRGIWLSNAKLSQRVRVPQPEPNKTPHFFINGVDASLKPFVELARKEGYSVVYQTDDVAMINLIDSQVTAKLQRWLRLLESH